MSFVCKEMTVETLSIGYGCLYNVIILLLLYNVARFLVNLYIVCLKMIRFKKQGLVSRKVIQYGNRVRGSSGLTAYKAHASSSILSLALNIAKDVMFKLPENAHPQYLPDQVSHKYPDVGPVSYLDIWQFTLPFLVVASPLAAYQLTQEHSQPESDGLRK
ncbi:hypothetical protein MMC16_006576 [Acarospora aff. strigata]|nr:hypothetical protein [Acarospora aff. strigata]